LYEEHVGLRFMPFDLAIRLSVDQHEGVVGKIGEQPHPKMMGIGGCIFFHRDAHLLE